MDVRSLIEKSDKYLNELTNKYRETIGNASIHTIPKPIIDIKVKEGSTLLVNKKPYIVKGEMKFPFFLTTLLLSRISEKWYLSEIKKKPRSRHPLASWISSFREQGSINHRIQISLLAYDSYVLEHNSFHKINMKRLLNKEAFYSYRYEILVASIFTRIGFDLHWLKSGNNSIVEFIAERDNDNKKYSVECKRRSAIDFNNYKASLKRLQDLALKKDPDFPYFIFIDANLPDREYVNMMLKFDQFILETKTSKGIPIVIIITNILDIYDEGWPKQIYMVRHKTLFMDTVTEIMAELHKFPEFPSMDYVLGSQ